MIVDSLGSTAHELLIVCCWHCGEGLVVDTLTGSQGREIIDRLLHSNRRQQAIVKESTLIVAVLT